VSAQKGDAVQRGGVFWPPVSPEEIPSR